MKEVSGKVEAGNCKDAYNLNREEVAHACSGQR
jgi:hypothetical protein